MIYVDSNVIIDILEDDPAWRGWSMQRIEQARLSGRVVTGEIVAAEVSHRADSPEQVEAAFRALGIDFVAGNIVSAFRAGQAYRLYRERGGERETLLADFLIGAHALTLEASLLTRDPRWYRRYFPELDLIHPDAENG